MPNFPKKLEKRLQKRKTENAFRELPKKQNLVDFSSNDYLGLAQCDWIISKAESVLESRQIRQHAATGSRLLTGNHQLYDEFEAYLSKHYTTETALVFNSGYDANIGLLSSVPQRGDLILYDELIHASIREGISMSYAKSYKFAHNDLESLKNKIGVLFGAQPKSKENEVYVVTESVFSMDGDSPDLKALVDFCSGQGFHLIVDEAHAIGVFGKGLVDRVETTNEVFARIITFGKALGSHGAAVLGGKHLKEYLVNFARSLIYTTAMSPHALAILLASYSFLEKEGLKRQEQLHSNIDFFKQEINRFNLENRFLDSNSAIHCMLVPGNQKVKELSQVLRNEGYDVKPILSPTVKFGEERLRFCLHSYNTKQEIENVLKTIREHI
ncbi:aminotransferase class I/II-fold pyridoxal phosphate-dependent enzyme [Flagellimonas meridianipacifica]|uniref:8-amino-7-oxononanoate synthase n=1 Tax=Flagellimonas meridianipacifica TaxID=1080225 RepID=A0A2T0MGB2_9FLAO|nr:aminotransferase class I/II-fold pyridoxal phosphate-dependent enzyme [Allomuricauda pacifica]PRX56627.1 8-amino-7-oxononanoate synthase [Allomuricauda pacifica]